MMHINQANYHNPRKIEVTDYHERILGVMRLDELLYESSPVAGLLCTAQPDGLLWTTVSGIVIRTGWQDMTGLWHIGLLEQSNSLPTLFDGTYANAAFFLTDIGRGLADDILKRAERLK